MENLTMQDMARFTSSPGEQRRLKEYLELAAARKEPDEPFIFDLEQNASGGRSTASTIWPCLLTHGKIFSMKKGRFATKSEYLMSMGWPALAACGRGVDKSCAQLLGFTTAEVKQLLGNSVHILSQLAFVTYVDSSVFAACRARESDIMTRIRKRHWTRKKQ
eukprot:2728765-Amphidinium_carterae.1